MIIDHRVTESTVFYFYCKINKMHAYRCVCMCVCVHAKCAYVCVLCVVRSMYVECVQCVWRVLVFRLGPNPDSVFAIVLRWSSTLLENTLPWPEFYALEMSYSGPLAE